MDMPTTTLYFQSVLALLPFTANGFPFAPINLTPCFRFVLLSPIRP